MPTGYTFEVCEGKMTDFSAFALQCARAFGAKERTEWVKALKASLKGEKE